MYVCVSVCVLYVDEVMIPLILIVSFQLSSKRPLWEILLIMSLWVAAMVWASKEGEIADGNNHMASSTA